MKMRPRLSPALAESLVSIYKNSSCSLILMAVLIFGHLLSYIQGFRQLFQLRPFMFFPPHFQLWTVATYWAVEPNILLLFFSLVCLHLAGKLIEPLWGLRELLTFYAINVASTALFCSVIAFFLYFLITDLSLFFEWSVTGFLGLAAGIQMAVKQLLPDSVLVNMGNMGRLKNTHIPMMNFVIQVLFTVIGLTTVSSLCMYFAGMYFSWVYLRFYQRHSNGQKGDPSDHFAFASLFPSILQPIVDVASSLVFRTLVRIKLCRPHVRRYNLQSAGGSLITTSTVTDAQRQRQKALRELNTRLNQSKAAEESLEWPALDEPASPSPNSDKSTEVEIETPSSVQQPLAPLKPEEIV